MKKRAMANFATVFTSLSDQGEDLLFKRRETDDFQISSHDTSL